ncbi:MAG TPA: hypothetical protein VMC84_05650 [Methanocella sp.]|uniref:hypothetical protein n=1 Tax=Methanocella sp. TaxID=2052833 RepID=UPI002C042D9B|nr:hypothetical protein [Methanocella sp.]HTY90644.1 hypothetical protein [Methanocella sp.]
MNIPNLLSSILRSRQTFRVLLVFVFLSYVALDTATTLYCVHVFAASGVNALDSEISPIVRVLGDGPLAVVEAKIFAGSVCIAGLYLLSRLDGFLESCNILAIALVLLGIVAGANNILEAWGRPAIGILGIPLVFIGLALACALEAYSVASLLSRTRAPGIEEGETGEKRPVRRPWQH